MILPELKSSIHLPSIDSNSTLSVSPSSRDLTLGSRDAIYIIDLENSTEKQQRRIPINSVSNFVRCEWHLFKSHQYLIATSVNQSLSLYNVGLPDPFCLLHRNEAHSRTITDIQWSIFDPNILVSISFDGFVKLWDIRMEMNKCIKRFHGNFGGTQSIWNFKNEFSIASSHGNSIYVWDVRKGSEPQCFFNEDCLKVKSIAWSHVDENELAVHEENSVLKFYDISCSKPNLIKFTSKPINASKLRFTPFGEGLIYASQDGCMSLSLNSCSEPGVPLKSIRMEDAGECVDFAWRVAEGSFERRDDNRQFELLTWGNDLVLRRWKFEDDLYNALGHCVNNQVSTKIDIKSYTKVGIEDDIAKNPSFLLNYPISSLLLRSKPSLEYKKPKERDIRFLRSRNSNIESKSLDMVGSNNVKPQQSLGKASPVGMSDNETDFETKRFGGIDRNNLRKIPYPRTCGASFTINGLLMYYSKSHKYSILDDKTLVKRDRRNSPVIFANLPRSLDEYPRLNKILVNYSEFRNAFNDLDSSEDEENIIGRYNKTHSPISSSSFASKESPYPIDQVSPITKSSADYNLCRYSKDLAKDYKIYGSKLDVLLESNRKVAENHNLDDVSLVWDFLNIFYGAEKEVPKLDFTPYEVPKIFRNKTSLRVKSQAKEQFSCDVVRELLSGLDSVKDVQTLAVISSTCDPIIKESFPKFINNTRKLSLVSPLTILFDQISNKPSTNTKSSDRANESLLERITFYKHYYAEMLYRWNLVIERAELLKSEDFDRSPGNFSLYLKSKCKICARELVGGGQVCVACARPTVLCSICDVTVRGRALYCLVCMHGGHFSHVTKWFRDNQVCPTGCGCKCVF